MLRLKTISIWDFVNLKRAKLLHITLLRLYHSSSKVSSSLPVQLQAALRPFIFNVHPDLFSQHPIQKSTNEESLKTLHEYIQQDNNKSNKLTGHSLKFYKRVNVENGYSDGQSSKPPELIKVQLSSDVLTSVREILQTNNLSTGFIDQLIEDRKKPQVQPGYSVDWIRDHYFAATGKKYPFTSIWEELSRLKPAVTLQWLESESLHLRNSYNSLKDEIIFTFGLADIKWSCGWRGIHQLASLRSFEKLLRTETILQHVIKDRVVMFGSVGGVSLNGDIILCNEGVPQQWSKALSNVSSSNKYLRSIPAAEKQLSNLLCNIQIKKRDMWPIPMADAYYYSLASLIGKLGMAFHVSPTKAKDLNHLTMIVSGSISDELVLTPEGHVNVPSHSPVWQIKHFIRDNEKSAIELGLKFNRDKEKADSLMSLVREEYSLQELSVDNSISYDQVITCCENLLSSSSIGQSLHGMRLCIAPFFSVMNDGEMYILWNWVDE